MAAQFQIVITNKSTAIQAAPSGGGAPGSGGAGGGGGSSGKPKAQPKPKPALFPTQNRPFWDPIAGRYASKGMLTQGVDPFSAYEGPAGGKQDPNKPKDPHNAGPGLKMLAGMTAAGIGLGGAFQDMAGIGGAASVGGSVGGPVGAALGAAVGVFSTAVNKFNESVDTMKKYSPDVAAASAKADVRSIMQDVREAQELGGGTGNFVEAWSQMQTELRDSLVPIKKAMLEIITPTLVPIGGFVGDIAKGAGVIVEMMRTMVNAATEYVKAPLGSKNEAALHEFGIGLKRMQNAANRPPMEDDDWMLRQLYAAGGDSSTGFERPPKPPANNHQHLNVPRNFDPFAQNPL